MPIYEYECQDCKQVFEEWQSGFEEKELVCPVCGTLAKRLISNTSFHLKGSGWYVTDYGGKSQSGSAPKDGNGNGHGKDTDSKGAAPTDSKAAKRQATREAARPAQTTAGSSKAAE